MHIIDLLLFLVTGSAVVLAVVVWRRRKTHLINISFSLFTLSSGLWAFSIALFRLSETTDTALSSHRIIYIMASLVACTFLYFAKEFPYVRKPFYRQFKYAIIIPFFTTLVLLYTPWFIQTVTVSAQGNTARLGWAFVVWNIWMLAYILWGLTELLIKYRQASSLHKMQLRYVFVAVALPFITAIPFAVILPWFENYHFLWLSPVSILGMIIIITYAIGRYRLIDIRLFLSQTITYCISALLLIGAGIILFFALNIYFLHMELDDAGMVTVLVIIAVALAGFNPILTVIQKFLNRYLFRTFYSHQDALKKLSRDITTIIDFNELMSAIIHTVIESIGLNKAAVLLIDDKISNRLNIATVVGFNHSIASVLMKHDFLVNWFHDRPAPLAFAELESLSRKAETAEDKLVFEGLQRTMLQFKIGVCLPLFYQNELYGVIVLGRKLSGDIYTSDDLVLLETVANQTTVAIEHARMYRDIQHIVDQQTAEIKDQNKELEDLLQVKSDFLTIVSHQLRTPMTAIRGFLSFLVEEDLPAEEKIHFAEQAFASANRMEIVVNDILTATELEGNEMTVRLEPTNLTTLVNDAISQARPLLSEKSLELAVKFKAKFAHILTDGRKLKDCLNHLIENAIFYTGEGKITVIIDHYRQYARIRVKDTGTGFTKAEAEQFGEKFYRADRVQRQVTDGSGLGLFITATFMKMLKGRLEFSSKGRGKGSTFTLLIPIKYQE